MPIDFKEKYPELSAFINAKSDEDLVDLAQKLKPTYDFGSESATPLMIAATLGLVDQVKALFDLDPDIDSVEAEIIAKDFDRVEVLKYLEQRAELEQKAKLEQQAELEQKAASVRSSQAFDFMQMLKLMPPELMPPSAILALLAAPTLLTSNTVAEIPPPL